MVKYLGRDLGTTGLLLALISLNQREADGEDQEERQEKVAEIHGCELPLLEWKGRWGRGQQSTGSEANLQWRAENGSYYLYCFQHVSRSIGCTIYPLIHTAL